MMNLFERRRKNRLRPWAGNARVALVSLAMIAGALAPHTAAAQTSPPPTTPPSTNTGTNASAVNPAAQLLPRTERASARDMLSAPESGPCPLAGSSLRFDFKSADITGVTVATAEELRATYASLLDQNVPVSDICLVRDRIAALIFSKGIFARVEIPEQTITAGQVKIEVIQARIGAVKVIGNAGPAQSLVEEYIEQLQGQETFSLMQAQRLLLLADDIPGISLAATLRSARQERGVVDMEVRVQRDPIDVIGNAQNFGSEALGPEALLMRADFNAYTAFGERTSLVLFASADGKEQIVGQALGEARFGRRGLIGEWSLAYSMTKPGGEAALLDLEGTSIVGKVGVKYPWQRSRVQNIFFSGGLEFVQQEVKSGSFALTDETLSVLYARADGDHSFKWRVPTNVRGGLELRQGLSSESKSPSRFDGVANAFVVRGDLAGEFKLTRSLTAYASADFQYSANPLLAYEEIAMGNLTTGRGYDPSSISGDTGALARFELRGGPYTGPVGTFWAYGFYDVGQVNNLDRAGEKVTAASAGIGLRFRLSELFDLDLAYAAPLDKVSEFADRKPPSRLLFNLISKLR
jgi:hemolysin activation/secretion protein